MALKSERLIAINATAGPGYAMPGQGVELARQGANDPLIPPTGYILSLPFANVVVNAAGQCAVMAFPASVTPPEPTPCPCDCADAGF